MARDPCKGYQLWTGIQFSYERPDSGCERGKIEAALIACDLALESNPRDADVLLQKAAILLGPYNNAAMLMFPLTDGLRDVDPRHGEMRFWLRHGDRAGEALALFETVLDFEPKNLKALWWKGSMLCAFDRWREAADSFARLLELDPGDRLAWAAKGRCLRELGCHEEALESYDHALELGPSYTDLTERVESTIEVGRLEEALELCDLVEMHPLYPSFTFIKGYVLALLGEYEEALEYMTAAADGPFIDLDARRFRPYLRYKTGDLLGARKELIALRKGFAESAVLANSATNLMKLPCDPAYRRLVESIDADR